MEVRPAVTPPVHVHATDTVHGLDRTLETDDHATHLGRLVSVQLVHVEVVARFEEQLHRSTGGGHRRFDPPLVINPDVFAVRRGARRAWRAAWLTVTWRVLGSARLDLPH